MNRIIVALLFLALFSSCKKETESIVKISTSYGDIKIRLYDETPLHRDNFLKLVKEKFYDGVLFHRVINHFMIQGGDPQSKGAAAGVMLGGGSPGYTVKAEFLPQYFHKKGALAAAREGDDTNPERRSSGSQFYITQGVVYKPGALTSAVQNINDRRKLTLYEQLKKQHEGEFSRMQEEDDMVGLSTLSEMLTSECDSLFKKEELVLTDQQKEAYTTIGGTPHLDGQYTVFGEIIEGLDVLDKIAAVKTDANNRPVSDVVITSVRLSN